MDLRNRKPQIELLEVAIEAARAKDWPVCLQNWRWFWSEYAVSGWRFTREDDIRWKLLAEELASLVSKTP